MSQATHTFDVVHGKHNFLNSSCKIAIFGWPKLTVASRKFLHMYMTKVGTTHYYPGSKSGSRTSGGWSGNTFELPSDYPIIGVQFSKTYRGALAGSCTKLILLDPTAPLIVVKARATPDVDAFFQEVPVFTGRGRAISVKKAKKHGLVFPDRYIDAYLDPEEAEEVFSVAEIGPAPTGGSDKLPEVVMVDTSSGKKRIVVSKGPTRKLKIRRKK